MLRIFRFLPSSIKRRSSFILLFTFCISQFSAQIFVKEGTALTIKAGSFISSDTIVYENKISSEKTYSVQSKGKIYVGEDAIITDPGHHLNADLVYVTHKKDQKNEKLPSLKKEKKKQLSAIESNQKEEIVIKKKPVFYKSSNTEEINFKNGRRTFAVVSGPGFSIKKIQRAHPILVKNRVVFFNVNRKKELIFSADHSFAVANHREIKPRGPPEF